MSPQQTDALQNLRPFLKWAGGKRQLIPQIMAKMPPKMETYYEAFVGGGAVFFELARHQRFEHAVISDQNLELVTTYRAIRDDVEGVISALGDLKHGEEAYYKLRAVQPRAAHRIAARMIFLNRTGFNGLYRVNRSGKFNVPFGHYKNPRTCDPIGLRAASRGLQGVEIKHADFEATVETARAGDVVYFDPPYLPVSATASFAQYHKRPFGADEHLRLARVYAELEQRGVSTLLSNSDTPATREIFGHFIHEFVPARRSINSNGTKRGPVNELLVFSDLGARAPEKPGLARGVQRNTKNFHSEHAKAG